MSFLPHSSRGRHAVDEQPADGERIDGAEPATGTAGDEPAPPANGRTPERPRYAFGYAPDDAGDDDVSGDDNATNGRVVRGDVVHDDGDVHHDDAVVPGEDEAADYPPVTVADIPAYADPPPTVVTPAAAPPTAEVPAMDADRGAAATDTPVPAPRPAPGFEPAPGFVPAPGFEPSTAYQPAAGYQPAVSEPVGADASLGEPLLDDAAALRARWQRTQSDFVDDPRAAVTDAAALVEQTAKAMMETLERRQRQLRAQWERGQAGDQNAPAGEPADTERLRLTMRSYRALFDQLCGR